MGDNRDTPQQLGTDSPAPSASTSARAAPPYPKKKPNPQQHKKEEVRILMLHGYTQSGPLFRAKTRALEKLLAKALAPVGLVPALVYPTAPNRLSVRDIPGYEPPSSAGKDGGDGGEGESEEMTDSWAWFRKDEASGRYRLVERGMVRLAEAMSGLRGGVDGGGGGGGGGAEGVNENEVGASDDAAAEGEGEGFVDGVIGFSQGGCMAAMLASAMEESRRTEAAAAKEHEGWVKAVRDANRGRPLKFAVIYSGFYAVPDDLAWLYEPKIQTPTLHFLGSLDTVVEESRSRGLVERCEEPLVMVHPGGHYVPVSKEWAMPLAGFIRKCLE